MGRGGRGRNFCLDCRRCTTEKSAGYDNTVVVGKRAQVAALWSIESAYLHSDEGVGGHPAQNLRREVKEGIAIGAHSTMGKVLQNRGRAANFVGVRPSLAPVRRPNVG